MKRTTAKKKDKTIRKPRKRPAGYMAAMRIDSNILGNVRIWQPNNQHWQWQLHLINVNAQILGTSEHRSHTDAWESCLAFMQQFKIRLNGLL